MIEFEDFFPNGWTLGNLSFRNSDEIRDHCNLYFRGTLVADADTEWKTVKKNGKPVSIYVMKIVKYHTTDPAAIQLIDDVLADMEFEITDATYADNLRRAEVRKIEAAKWAEHAAAEELVKQEAANKAFDGVVTGTRQRELSKKRTMSGLNWLWGGWEA